MKKFLFSAAAVALLSGMASCTSDEPAAPSGDGNVTFRVSLPADMATRSYSDGLTATQLHYYVYDEDNGSANLPALNGTATFAGRVTDISLSLASGKSYSIVFWADAPGNNAYTYDISSKEIKVTYDGVAQDENRDAFTAYESTFKVSGPINKSIILKRPLAQINVGTGDVAEAAAAGVEVKNTGMKVKGVYNKLNLATGAVDVDGSGEVTFTSAAIPGDDEDFPVGGYDYLAMNYVLVAADKATVDVTLTTDCAQNPEMTFSQVPVQRNYRTNIYGKLLTDPADFKVIIDQEYAGEDNNVEVVKATTPEQFVDAINAGSNVVVPAGASVDLIGKGPIELADNQTIKVQGVLNTERAQIGISGAGNVAYVEGPGKITSIGVAGATGNRPLNAYDGGTLVVRNVEIETEQNNGGSVIFSENGNLDLANVTVNCHNFAIGANGGTLKMKDCIINSDSNNREGSFSYTVSVATGCKAVIEGGEINGIQGGLTVQGEGAECIVKGGTYTTKNHPQYGNIAFYPVYATDKGVAIIEGGDFIGANDWSPNKIAEGTSALVAGDNDVHMPDGNFVIKGGRFSGKAYNHVSKKLCDLPKGYSYKAIEGAGDLKWEVVKD